MDNLLEQAQHLLEEITPGEFQHLWGSDNPRKRQVIRLPGHMDVILGHGSRAHTYAAFIAAAPALLLALTQEVRKLRIQKKMLHDQRDIAKEQFRQAYQNYLTTANSLLRFAPGEMGKLTLYDCILEPDKWPKKEE